jgi:hypothetical protein
MFTIDFFLDAAVFDTHEKRKEGKRGPIFRGCLCFLAAILVAASGGLQRKVSPTLQACGSRLHIWNGLFFAAAAPICNLSGQLRHS